MGLISENHPGITDEKQAGSFFWSPLAAVLSSSSSLSLLKSVTEASLESIAAVVLNKKLREITKWERGNKVFEGLCIDVNWSERYKEEAGEVDSISICFYICFMTLLLEHLLSRTIITTCSQKENKEYL